MHHPHHQLILHQNHYISFRTIYCRLLNSRRWSQPPLIDPTRSPLFNRSHKSLPQLHLHSRVSVTQTPTIKDPSTLMLSSRSSNKRRASSLLQELLPQNRLRNPHRIQFIRHNSSSIHRQVNMTRIFINQFHKLMETSSTAPVFNHMLLNRNISLISHSSSNNFIVLSQ